MSKPLPTAALLALDGLPEDARHAHERKIARLSRACGCPEGAIGSLTLVALAAWRVGHTFSGWSLAAIASLTGQLLLALVLGGFAGKFVGLAIASARLRALCRRLERDTARLRT